MSKRYGIFTYKMLTSELHLYIYILKLHSSYYFKNDKKITHPEWLRDSAHSVTIICKKKCKSYL